MPSEMPDRRPIAARNTSWAAFVAAWLVRRRVSPNAISVAGAVAACAAGALFSATPYVSGPAARVFWVLGAALVQLRLLCNLFDGMVAVGSGIASPRGELFNEVPDRVSDTAVLCGLGVVAGFPALGWAAALAAMATAYVRALGRGTGHPADFSGPMAKQHRMAVVTVLAVLCALLPFAWTVRLPEAALWLITVGATATALRRLLRLAWAL